MHTIIVFCYAIDSTYFKIILCTLVNTYKKILGCQMKIKINNNVSILKSLIATTINYFLRD